jgi:hypothetical protein
MAVHRVPLGRQAVQHMCRGRGLAAATCAFSTFLHHTEFANLPAEPVREAFPMRVVAAISKHVPRALLLSSRWGHGLLPLRQHVHAHRAAMASRLLRHLLSIVLGWTSESASLQCTPVGSSSVVVTDRRQTQGRHDAKTAGKTEGRARFACDVRTCRPAACFVGFSMACSPSWLNHPLERRGGSLVARLDRALIPMCCISTPPATV